MRAVFLCFFILGHAALYGQSVVQGYVYEDKNANGRKDRGEKGVEGVAVSNGIEVSLTNADGKYELPVSDDNIIFVIKPSGYTVPVNDKNQPQFYYIHKPKGAPTQEFRYKGAPPTGKLPRSVDFALLPGSESDSFTALVFGDPQPYTLEEIDHFSRGIIDELAGVNGVRFGLSLGDLVGDNLDLHNPYIEAVRRVGTPWYNLMGNHDMNYEARYDSLSDETFEYHFGPANYAFNEGKVHFIALDDILYPDPRDGDGYAGGFRPSQLAFVRNTLKYVPTDWLVVVAFHIPLHGASFLAEHRTALFDALRNHPRVLILSAHTHLQRNDFYTKSDGWHHDRPIHEYNAGTTSGDWYSGELDERGVPYSTMRDGTRKGYAFIDFTGNDYVIDYKVAGMTDDYRMEIYAPKVIPNTRTSAGLYVNFFMGTANDKVEFRIGDGPWQRMARVEDADPAYMALLFEWDMLEELIPGRRPSNAVKSTHLWRASFPRNMAVGNHMIEVRTTDMFGRTFTQKRQLRVQEPVTVEQ